MMVNDNKSYLPYLNELIDQYNKIYNDFINEKPINSVTTSDLAAKKDFIALKDDVDKLDIAKLVNVRTTLNNLKTKVDNLEVGKLKAFPVDVK